MNMIHSTVQQTIDAIRQDTTLTGVGVHTLTQTPPTIEKVLETVRNLGENRDFVILSILAVFVSTFLDQKDPVWLMIVGNPSSNKTTLVDLLKDVSDVYRLDSMTANPFSSGQREKDKPQDLLPLLNGKCFIIKEYGTLFGRSDEMVKQLISDLVAIYDGEYSKHSPTRGTIRYETYFSHIGCVTPMSLSSRQRYMNAVGARFLFLRIPALAQSEREKNLEGIWNAGNRKSKEEVAEVIYQFCVYLKAKVHGGTTIHFSDDAKKSINQLALLTARARGIVITEKTSFKNDEGVTQNHYEVSDIQVEEPFRALKQLRKMAKSLAIVCSHESVGKKELEILRRITLSSMPVRRADVLRVFEKGNQFTAKQAADVLEKNYRTVKRNFDELVSLEVLSRKKGNNDKANVYSLNPCFIEVFPVKEKKNNGLDSKGVTSNHIADLFGDQTSSSNL